MDEEQRKQLKQQARSAAAKEAEAMVQREAERDEAVAEEPKQKPHASLIPSGDQDRYVRRAAANRNRHDRVQVGLCRLLKTRRFSP